MAAELQLSDAEVLVVYEALTAYENTAHRMADQAAVDLRDVFRMSAAATIRERLDVCAERKKRRT